MKENKRENENQQDENKSHFEKTQQGKKIEETDPNNLKAIQNDTVVSNPENSQIDSALPGKEDMNPEGQEIVANTEVNKIKTNSKT